MEDQKEIPYRTKELQYGTFQYPMHELSFLYSSIMDNTRYRDYGQITISEFKERYYGMVGVVTAIEIGYYQDWWIGIVNALIIILCWTWAFRLSLLFSSAKILDITFFTLCFNIHVGIENLGVCVSLLILAILFYIITLKKNVA